MFEDAKRVTRILKSKKDRQYNDQMKDRQYNDQMKNDKRTNDFEQHEPTINPDVNSGTSEVKWSSCSINGTRQSRYPIVLFLPRFCINKLLNLFSFLIYMKN